MCTFHLRTFFAWQTGAVLLQERRTDSKLVLLLRARRPMATCGSRRTRRLSRYANLLWGAWALFCEKGARPAANGVGPRESLSPLHDALLDDADCL
jgi:hypothetical protein